MNVSYDWLRKYCDLTLSPEELAERLPELGLQVESIERVGGDRVLALEITANRADLLSMFGVAREVAAATGSELKIPAVNLKASGPAIASRTSVSLEAPDLCLRYTARLVSGVRIGPSPAWLTQRLDTVGLRPVNNVVDVTNFVLMECGQPLHAFDFDKLRGRRIVVRRARPDEPITVIDGTVHKLTGEMLVIADAEVPTAVAGIMGGLETEISGRTTNVLIESAQFLPANIRRTERALGLSSDSSYRFERGIDPRMVEWGSERAAALIAEIAGGQVAEGMIDVGEPVAPERVVRLRPKRASAVLGVEIPAAEQKKLLEPLGFAATEREGEFDVRVPTFRLDVSSEIDLIEEIARTFGYGNIPDETAMRVRPAPVQKVDAVSEKARDLCVGLGYAEARTVSFSPVALSSRFRHWSQDVNVLRNPVNREEPALRTSLVPGLLRVKRTNLNRGAAVVALFEIGHVYERAEGKPSERTCLAFVDDRGFASLRGALDELLSVIGLRGPVECVEYGDANFAAGRSARVVLKAASTSPGGNVTGEAERTLGFAGEASAELAALFDLRNRPAIAELDFDLLVAESNLLRRFEPLPKFPPVRRDLCVVVDEPVRWADLRACAEADAGEFAESIGFESEYRGEQIPRGKKAVAFAVTYRAKDRTLTGEEADAAIARVAAALGKRFGATLRA